MDWNIFYLSLIPAILWILYFYYNDKYEKEPFHILLWTFLLGCLSVIPAVIFEFLFQYQIDFHIPFGAARMLITMLMVGFAEEICKFYVVKMYAYKKPDFNEPMDGIVYCVTAAMGFAFIENIAYMFGALATGGLIGAYSIGIMRAIFSMFGHASFGVIQGSYFGRAKFDKPNESSLFAKGIIFSAIVHTLYNFSLFISKEILLGALVLLSFLLVWRNMNRVQIDSAEDISPFKPLGETYTPKKWHWGVVNVLSVLSISFVIIFALFTFEKPIKFENKKMRYIIQLPSYWKKRANKSYTLLELSGPAYKNTAPIMLIEIREGKEDYRIEDTLTEFIKEKAAKMKDLEKISSENITINNKTGIIAKARWKKDEKQATKVPMISYLALFKNENSTVYFLCDAREDQFERYKTHFKNIITSFQFK